jgi:hypothetical protein
MEAKRQATEKKLTDLDRRVYEETGILPDDFPQDLPPHEMGETLDWSQFAGEIKRHKTLPESLAFVLEAEMAGTELNLKQWHKRFPESNPATWAHMGETTVVALTGEELRRQRREDRGETEKEPAEIPAIQSESLFDSQLLSVPEKIPWHNYSADDLMRFIPQKFLSPGSAADPQLDLTLSKTKQKVRDWDIWMQDRLGLLFYDSSSDTHRLRTYYRTEPVTFVTLYIGQKEELLRYFFLEEEKLVS